MTNYSKDDENAIESSKSSPPATKLLETGEEATTVSIIFGILFLGVAASIGFLKNQIYGNIFL
ncbi:LPXTG cell wall anchor domain-containing protein [Listeria monocytogenes]|nr:LPXTG cell wall anchor domain-containing protein [Listeria monocytogenes]